MIITKGQVHEVSKEEEHELTRNRTYSGGALMVPEKWQYDSKLRLMQDTFTEEDEPNVVATMTHRKLKHPNYTPDDVICGAVFLSNESMDELKDFAMQDFQLVMQRAGINMYNLC